MTTFTSLVSGSFSFLNRRKRFQHRLVCILLLSGFPFSVYSQSAPQKNASSKSPLKSTKETTTEKKKAQSQISTNPAKKAPAKSTPHIPEFTGQLSIDLRESFGNFEQFNLSSRGSLYKRWNNVVSVDNRFTFNYMEIGGRVFNDLFRDMMMITTRPLSNINLFFMGLYHQNFVRFIDWRWMTGAGVAWSPVSSKENQMRLSVGGAHEWTTLDNRPPPFSMSDEMLPAGQCAYQHQSDPMSCQRQMWRVIPRIAGHYEFLQHHFILNYEALWVVDPVNMDDYRVFLSFTLTIPLNSWLSVYGHYDWSYESIVLDHREKSDTHRSIGFRINFKDSHLGY